MAILQLVDQMTELLSEGREVPLSRYRMIDAEEFGQILERMRISVPSSIRESERTLVERDNILAQARKEADKIIQEARDIAADMLSDNSLVVMARQESQRIIDDGHEVARQRTSEADGYATQVLQELHDKLSSISSQVENGITVMTQSSAEPMDSAVDEYGSTSYEREAYDQRDSGSSTLRRINNPLTGGRSTSFDTDSSFRDYGLSDSGYGASGFTDSGYSSSETTDSGYTDSGYTDSGFDDSGYSDRYQMNAATSFENPRGERGVEVRPFDNQFDSQFDNQAVAEAQTNVQPFAESRPDFPQPALQQPDFPHVDTQEVNTAISDMLNDESQKDSDSSNESTVSPPVNHLSNPSDSMSEHL